MNSNKKDPQIFANYLTFISLLAFIVFSWSQSCQTRKAIYATQVANRIAQRSFDSTISSNTSSDALNRKAIEIADSSMRISERIAALQEDFGKAELRPYLTVDSFMPTLAVNQVFSYRVKVINKGKTPAYRVTGNLGYKFGGTGVYDADIKGIDNLKTEDPPIYKPIGIGGSDYLFFGRNKRINFATYSEVMNGETIIYLMGIVFYEDIFGDKHKTVFCWQYAPWENKFYIYERYNYAD